MQNDIIWRCKAIKIPKSGFSWNGLLNTHQRLNQERESLFIKFKICDIPVIPNIPDIPNIPEIPIIIQTTL